MASIKESEIICPHLKRAFDKAERDAYDKMEIAPASIDCPEEYNQNLTLKGVCTGSSTCDGCGKVISVVFHLRQLTAKNTETGKSVKVFSKILPNESIGVSGHKCISNNRQKQIS